MKMRILTGWMNDERSKTFQQTRCMYKVRCKTDRSPRDCWMSHCRRVVADQLRRRLADTSRLDRRETFTTRKEGCCVTLRMQPDDLIQRILYHQKQHAVAGSTGRSRTRRVQYTTPILAHKPKLHSAQRANVGVPRCPAARLLSQRDRHRLPSGIDDG